MGKSYGGDSWKSNPQGYTSGRPRGLGRCRPRGLRDHPAPCVPGGTARLWGRSAPARRWRALPHHRKPLPCMRCRSRRCRWRTPPPKPPLAWWRGGLALVTPPRPNRGLGGNDPVGEFREPALAPHRLELLELSVGRTDSSGLLRRYRLSQASCDEEGGCLSFRDSTIPPLRSDTTFHSSLRAGCRVTISRSMRRSRARNTSRVTST